MLRIIRLLWFPAVLGLWIGTQALAQDVKEIHKTLPLAADGRVTLDSYKGRVQIATWDQPSVEIHARIEPDGVTDQRAQVQATEMQIDASAGAIHIRTDFHRVASWDWCFLFGGDRPLVHYTIRMPRTAKLQVRDQRSDIRVGDLRAGLDLNTYRGAAVVSSVEGPVRLETYRGRIRVGSAAITGSSRVDTYRGEIEMGIPRHRGLDLDFDIGRHARLSGDLAASRDREGRPNRRLNGGGPTLHLKAYRGALRLTTV